MESGMAEGEFQVVFRGELTGERPEDEVKQNLSALFKMPLAKVEALFSGKPIVVKRNLDQATAKKFDAAFRKAGAKCEIRAPGGSAKAQPEPAAARSETTAAPTPSTGGRRPPSVAAAGDPNNTQLDIEVPDDLSGLDVDTSDAPLAPPSERPEPDIDIGDLSVAPADSGNLSEREPPPPADIDTSELSLEDPER